jgi:predicted DNA-binding WGR domain protein
MKIRWENEERGRYYVVHLYRDLLGDWRLTRIWGRKGSALGQTRHEVVESEQAGRALIDKIAIRRRQRGYRIREESEDTFSLSQNNE